MIPPHTYARARLAEERRADVMRDGELAALIRMGRPAKCGVLDKLMAALGERLESLGEALQARHLPTSMDLHDPVLHGKMRPG
jgi:hypothetical protein